MNECPFLEIAKGRRGVGDWANLPCPAVPVRVSYRLYRCYSGRNPAQIGRLADRD